MLFIQDCIGPNRERSEGLDLDRRGMESESAVGQILQSAHVLADGDAIAKQNCMSGACAVCYIVDVIGIDANEGRAGICQDIARPLV